MTNILFLQIVSIENGTELGPNEDGEICVRGPTVMKGRKQLKFTVRCGNERLSCRILRVRHFNLCS